MSNTQAAVATRPSVAIDLEGFAAIMEVSTVTERIDIGTALIYKASHPELGNIVLVNTTGDRHALLHV